MDIASKLGPDYVISYLLIKSMSTFYTQALALSNKLNKIKIEKEMREEKHFLWIVDGVTQLCPN